jgi:hypothetical protein
MSLRRLLPFLGLAALVAAGLTAYARPPAGADPNSPMAQWHRTSQRPDGLGTCCSESDCRPTAYRIVGGHYEALVGRAWDVDEEWVPVPDAKVLQHTDNPTGTAVLCYTPSIGVLCFVLPAQT